jgi:hypothetical protein
MKDIQATISVSLSQKSFITVQIQVSSLLSRFAHSSVAFGLSPELTDVTLFGGCPEWPSNYNNNVEDLTQIANTTVLRYGEFAVSHMHHT